jgi:hypothetical protein
VTVSSALVEEYTSSEESSFDDAFFAVDFACFPVCVDGFSCFVSKDKEERFESTIFKFSEKLSNRFSFLGAEEKRLTTCSINSEETTTESGCDGETTDP